MFVLGGHSLLAGEMENTLCNRPDLGQTRNVLKDVKQSNNFKQLWILYTIRDNKSQVWVINTLGIEISLVILLGKGTIKYLSDPGKARGWFTKIVASYSLGKN